MSDWNNKFIPDNIDKLTRKELAELCLLQFNENVEMAKRIQQLERELEIAERHLHDEHFDYYAEDVEQLRKRVGDE